jgi:hypothetical protein
MGIWLAEHAIATAISIVGGILATFLAKKVGAIMDAIEEKANIDIDDKIEARIQQTVRKVVMATTQTFVSGLKEKGEFNEVKKAEALEGAIEEVGQIIFDEIGVSKTSAELKLSIEAEIGEQKEVLRVVGARG